MQRLGRDLALFDRWFQAMTRKIGCGHDIKLKFSKNVSNRIIFKATKFRGHSIYEKKSYGKNATGGQNPPPPPPVGIGLRLISTAQNRGKIASGIRN